MKESESVIVLRTNRTADGVELIEYETALQDFIDDNGDETNNGFEMTFILVPVN